MPKKLVLDAVLHANIVEQYRDGVSMSALARMVGITIPTMRRVLKDAGCVIRPGSRSKPKGVRPVAGVVGLKETADDRQNKVDDLRLKHTRTIAAGRKANRDKLSRELGAASEEDEVDVDSDTHKVEIIEW